jgi:RND superfamily putative drug exporter
MERLILRTTALCVRRPWWVVGAWILAVLIALPFAGRAQGRLSSGGFEVPGSQSQTAIDYLNALPGRGAYSFSFLVDARSAQAAQARAAAIRAEVSRRFPIIRFRTRPQVSPDGRTISFLGFAPIDQNQSLRITRDLKRLVQHTDGPVRTYLLGPSANFAAFQDITERGLTRAETFSSPIILIVLLVLFGAVVATLVPAGLGAVSVAIAFAIVYGVAAHTEVSVYATTMVTMIGVGVAVDYSMFILARFREELEAGTGTSLAVETAMRTSGTAVAFSGMTVVVSLASVLIVPVRALQSMALAAVIVVAIAVVAGMTLLPAVLQLLGPRINGLRVPSRRGADRSRFWLAWSRRVMRRPLLSAGGAAAVLIVLSLPAFAMVTANRSLEQLPASTDVRVANDILTRRITGPGQGHEGALTILVRPSDAGAAGAAVVGAEVRDRLARDPLIAAASLERAGPGVLVVGELRVDPESSLATDTLVPRVRAWVGRHGLVSGVSAFNHDLNEQVGGDLWKVMALVLGLSARAAAVGRAAAEGGDQEPALDRRVLRRDRGRVPVGLVRLDRLPLARPHQHADACADPRDHLRPGDGLRGVPAVADP